MASFTQAAATISGHTITVSTTLDSGAQTLWDRAVTVSLEGCPGYSTLADQKSYTLGQPVSGTFEFPFNVVSLHSIMCW